MEQNLKATHRLIDSVWTLEYQITPDNKAKIIKYSRNDTEGYKNEKSLPQCNVNEDDERTVTSITIRPKYKQFDNFVKEGEEGSTTFEVINPEHVFDYGA
jgi:hypothetical protein